MPIGIALGRWSHRAPFLWLIILQRFSKEDIIYLVYVDMGLSTNNPITLTVVSSGASFSRSFSIKVTQIECNSLAKASDGCLQYFTGVSGQMFSFNYNDASGLMLSNTDYSICVRTERNFCGIQYTACTDSGMTSKNDLKDR